LDGPSGFLSLPGFEVARLAGAFQFSLTILSIPGFGSRFKQSLAAPRCLVFGLVLKISDKVLNLADDEMLRYCLEAFWIM
jgi:hypothetical protein